MTGEPKLPGISSISFGEAHECSKKKAESTNTERSTNFSKMLKSMATQ
jgi:hypothetical protein